MKLKEFLAKTLKPSMPKIIMLLLAIILASYFSKEETCGAFMFFAFCYKLYGFPFPYIVTGDIGSEVTLSHIKTLFLGGYFIKSWNLLFNPAALILNLALVYVFSCFAVEIFKKALAKYNSQT